VDFALVRFRAYIEIDGFSHHAKFLEDHKSDRLRGLYFSARDWVPFRIAHGQAIKNPGILIDALEAFMKIRQPIPRSEILIEPITHKHGVWYQLRCASE
jgi:very-short-patch-repair endonuclease